MEYLIDTNICIYYFKGQFKLKEKIEKIGFANIAISEITLAELIYGAEKSQKTEENLKVVEDFADKIKIFPILTCLRVYGKEKARWIKNKRQTNWRFRFIYRFDCCSAQYDYGHSQHS